MGRPVRVEGARSVGERRVANRGAEVGEEIEILAQPQEAGLGAVLIGDVRPFRAADGPENDRVGLFGLLDRLVGDGDAVGVIGRAADEIGFDIKSRRVALSVEKRNQPFDLGDGFDTDPPDAMTME